MNYAGGAILGGHPMADQQKQEESFRWERMTLGDMLREREDSLHKELARIEAFKASIPTAMLNMSRETMSIFHSFL